MCGLIAFKLYLTTEEWCGGAAYPGLVHHVGHLVDPVQQHLHLALHVLPLPLGLLYCVLQHLKVSGLPHHLGLHLLLLLLHADDLGLEDHSKVSKQVRCAANLLPKVTVIMVCPVSMSCLVKRSWNSRKKYLKQ